MNKNLSKRNREMYKTNYSIARNKIGKYNFYDGVNNVPNDGVNAISVGSYGVSILLGMNIWLKPDRSGVSVLFPNDEYWIDQDTTLANYPVVIKSRNKIVYCDFEDFSHVLEKVDDDYDYKFLSRKFFNMETKQYQTAEIMFADLAHTDNKPSPWIFMCEDLEKCRARSTNDNLLKILNIDLTENDLWVRVERIGMDYYATRILLVSDASELPTPFNGWNIEENAMYRYTKEKNVEIVGWEKIAVVYEKPVLVASQKFSKKMSTEFVNFVMKKLKNKIYETACFEINDSTFFYNKERALNSLNNLVKCKAQENVERFVDEFLTSKFDDLYDIIPGNSTITRSEVKKLPLDEMLIERLLEQFNGKEKINCSEFDKYYEMYSKRTLFKYVIFRDQLV